VSDPRIPKLTYDQERYAESLRAQAWSLGRIGRELGVSTATISRVMHRRGVVAPRQRQVRKAGRRPSDTPVIRKPRASTRAVSAANTAWPPKLSEAERLRTEEAGEILRKWCAQTDRWFALHPRARSILVPPEVGDALGIWLRNTDVHVR
jgi:Helix-turn-helix domain